MSELSADDVEALELQILKTRAYNLGNVKFIGLLFKKGLLTLKVLHGILSTLIGDAKRDDHLDVIPADDFIDVEEDYEHFIHLMKIVGKKIDIDDNGRALTDVYIRRMDKLSKNRVLGSRIRFAFQDVMDMRKRRWKNRKGDDATADQPKTIHEVHVEEMMKRRAKEEELRIIRNGPGGSRVTYLSSPPSSDLQRGDRPSILDARRSVQPVAGRPGSAGAGGAGYSSRGFSGSEPSGGRANSRSARPQPVPEAGGWRKTGGTGSGVSSPVGFGRGKARSSARDIPDSKPERSSQPTNMYDLLSTSGSPPGSPLSSSPQTRVSPPAKPALTLEAAERKVLLVSYVPLFTDFWYVVAVTHVADRVID